MSNIFSRCGALPGRRDHARTTTLITLHFLQQLSASRIAADDRADHGIDRVRVQRHPAS
jgi:hypothetical protein